MNAEAKRKLYEALCAPFPNEAIERTNGKQTGRGYDTAGVKVQWIIDRLNEVVGVGNWRVTRETSVHATTTGSGRKMYEAWSDVVLQLGEWSGDTFVPFAEARAYGAHTAITEGDARKGAASNGTKRAAAMMGCGAAAYRGELDDDNQFDVDGGEPVAPQAPRAVPARMAAPRPQPSSGPRSAIPPRNRITAKQHAALLSMSRRLGYDQAEFRNEVKSRFGKQLDYISREEASMLISSLSNGGLDQATDAEPDMRETGEEG